MAPFGPHIGIAAGQSESGKDPARRIFPSQLTSTSPRLTKDQTAPLSTSELNV